MKPLLRSIIVICAILLTGTTIYGQGKTENLEKYWKYRTDLVNEFVVVGSKQGMSLPAGRRDSAEAFIKWADQTISLGWYIGMLATEYELITNPLYQDFSKDKQKALAENLEEIYYAVLALKRLDEHAEAFFEPECNSVDTTFNGFFIRDDISSEFVNNHYPEIDSFFSDYVASIPEINEMSQDQAYHLLMGLALIKRFIPDSLQYNGVNIYELAVNQSNNIAQWISRDDWKIKNPGCNNRYVYRGSNAYFFGAGTAEAIKFITGESWIDTLVEPSQTTAWDFLTASGNPAYQKKDNLHMAMTIAAIGAGWGVGTFGNLMSLATKHDYYLYPLLAIVLHDSNNFDNIEVFEDQLISKVDGMLNSAPANGFYSPYPDSNNHGWGVGKRFLSSIESQYKGKAGESGNKYNALDYQVLHNLYYLAYPTKWDSTISGTQGKSDDILYLNIAPNPAREYFKVLIQGINESKWNLEVYNVSGESVFRKSYETPNDIMVDCSDFESGIYFIALKSKKNKVYHSKLLIQD